MKLCSFTSSFSRKSNSFSYERFCTGTRFETEAQGYSEMACYDVIVVTWRVKKCLELNVIVALLHKERQMTVRIIVSHCRKYFRFKYCG